MRRKENEFDAEALVVGVEAFAAHVQGKRKLTIRTHQVPRSKPIAPMPPEGHRCAAPKTSVPKVTGYDE